MISTQHLMPTVAPTAALTANGKTPASTPQPPSGMTSQSKDGGQSFRLFYYYSMLPLTTPFVITAGNTTPAETSKTSTPPLKIDNPAEETADVPMDIDIENDNKTPAPPGVPTAQSVPPPALNSKVPSSSAAYPGGHMIDVGFEACKLPLDVAIFNSSRAAGGDDKIRKYLQAVLVIGGTALLPGMAHALESR
jgi:actin-related protein 8